MLQSEADSGIAKLEAEVVVTSQQRLNAQQSCEQLSHELLQAKAECCKLSDLSQVGLLHPTGWTIAMHLCSHCVHVIHELQLYYFAMLDSTTVEVQLC